MCRHLGWLGPPRSLRELVYDPPFSLHRQSYAPRMNGACLLNADGYGVGWYPPGRDRPARFRRAQPIWTDQSFAGIAEVIESGCALAAVRSATEGFPVEESCAQPFTSGPWLFCHNGRVGDFGSVEARLRELAGDLAGVPDARAPVDSALLLAMAVGRWRGGCPLGEGLAGVVADVAPLAPSRLNLLATDGEHLAATAYGGDSLFVREFGGGGVAIASEPWDDEPGWRRVPEGSLVTAGPRGVSVAPLEVPSAGPPAAPPAPPQASPAASPAPSPSPRSEEEKCR